LLCAVFFWVLFGWLADYSFPFGQALELFLSCFTGTVSAKINSLQQQLQRTDIIPQPSNTQQVQKLNNLESQAWLYKGILERLGTDPSANHEKIAKTLEALEYKRSEILQELEPRRPRSYRVLAEIQDSARAFLASQAEKDYEQLEKIVINLVLFASSRQPSQAILSEAINKLAVEIAQSSNQISPYRLRLAYKLDELMKAISSRLILGSTGSKTDSGYQALVNELRSRINLLSNQFNNLLKAKQESKSQVNRQIQEISSLTRNISDLHRAISNRDADITTLRNNNHELTELSRRKEAQINNLQNLISELQRNIQGSAEVAQRKQSQINHLQSQLSQLNQEKKDLQNRIQTTTDYARRKESEVANLESEKSQLELQRLELKRQYQSLCQNYQQNQNEIADLKKKLEDLTETNPSKPQPPKQKTSQAAIKPIATQRKISVQKWEQISNQSDYEYVNGYLRQNGTWVNAYYRRPRRRRAE
jgi:myosin heavy subunit